MSEPSQVRFGVFELDARTGELRKHGVRLKIQDQPFQVLQVLLERPGELVTREELQTRIWAHDTFVDFDQSLNRAINKVRDVLSDTAGAPRFIETLPRRGYRFIAPVEAAPRPGPAETAPPPELPRTATRPYRWTVWLAAGCLSIAGAGLWLMRDRSVLSPPRIVPLTTLTGREMFPAFSPDGKQVVFSWNGEGRNNDEGGNNFDLYVKVVGDETQLCLTHDPANDGFPAWSADGRQIAFTSERDGGGVYLVSPLGGPDRKLASLVTSGRPSWSPDGKYLLVAQRHDESKKSGDGALFLIPVASGGDPRQVLTPPPGTWYQDPAYAPDGRSLALASRTGISNCTIQIAGLKDGLVPSGDLKPIQDCRNSLGIAWMADGSSLIYGDGGGEIGHLWRVGIRNRTKAQRVELAGSWAYYPAIDFTNGRLAFHRSISNIDVWRMGRDGKSLPFLTSSLVDGNSQYSPDGRRVAFSSSRGGDSIAIWVANADGTGVSQLSRIASSRSGDPSWAPNGERISFAALGKGGYDIWVMEANGGSTRQLTHDSSGNANPSWSRDGRSIYFRSKRSGRFEIWRVPFQGGTPEQITRNGGYVAFESTDATKLYYTVSQAGTEGIYAKQLPDGEERQVVNDGVAQRGLAVFPDGVYYLHSRDQRHYEIRFHEFASGRAQVIGQIEGRVEAASGLGVSPDRKTFLFSKVIAAGSDLMLIENFR